MQAITYRTDGQGRLNRTKELIRDLGTRDVRVAVSAVSLNFRDLPFVRGNQSRAANNGRIPCSDAVGRVEAIGSEVTRVSVGDRVSPTILPHWIDGPLNSGSFRGSFGSDGRDGVLTDKLVVEEDALVRVPDYLSDLQAASLPTAGVTAWHAMAELGALRAFDTAVIETTGGVAIFALQIALAFGVRPIITSRSDAKLARARSLGAWRTINSQKNPSWDEMVMELTGGAGAQLVLDMGLRDGLPRSSRAAAFEGTVAVVGVVEGWKTVLDIGPVMNKNLRVRGVETGSRAMLERMNEFFAKTTILPVIDSTFGFMEVDKALEALSAGPFGKVVIDLASA